MRPVNGFLVAIRCWARFWAGWHRLPIPSTTATATAKVYRDVAWASASTAAFAAMTQAEHEFSATPERKIWRNNTQILWESRLQADGAWLIDNKQAGYQMRLSPVTDDAESSDVESSDTAQEVMP